MPEVVDIRMAEEPRDVIHQAVRVLAEGGLVAFPSETRYFVAAHSLKTESVGKLGGFAGSRDDQHLQLVVKGADEALDLLPHMSRMGRKLSRRCWPGPVTIAFDVASQDGLLGALPGEVQKAVIHSNYVRLRAPAHDTISEVLKLTPAPLVALGNANSNGESLRSAAGIVEKYGDGVTLVIDDGDCRYGQPESVISIDNEHWQLVTPGVVTETTLNRLASEVFLFVCTGNTCRSPLAEGLFRKMLSEKLQCSQEGLYDRGYVVMSAGISAAAGAPASPESVELAAKRGIDLRPHESQPLTSRLLDQADYVFAMTRGHRDAIVQFRPDVADRVQLLACDQSDIPDPIGGGIEDYHHSEREIERHLRSIVASLELK